MREPERLDVEIVGELVRAGLIGIEAAPLALAVLMSSGLGVRTVRRLARRLGVSVRTVRRLFAAVGLRHPRAWLVLRPILVGVIALQRGEPLKVAARAGGFSEEFTFSNSMRRFTGLRPSDARRARGWVPVLQAWAAYRQPFIRKDGARWPSSWRN
jgi:AraC-like DNA-binding protein